MNKDERQQSGGVSQDAPAGRFNGEDIEFESFMFDAGEDNAIKHDDALSHGSGPTYGENAHSEPNAEVAVPHSFEGQQDEEPEAAHVPSPVTGEEVQMPAYMQADNVAQEQAASQIMDAAVRDSGAPSSAPSTPLQGRLGRGVVGSVDTGPMSTDANNASGPLPQRLGAETPSPASGPLPVEEPAGWSDGSLGAIEDFSAVLIALRASKNATVIASPGTSLEPAAPAVLDRAQAGGRNLPDWAAQAVSDMAPAIASEPSAKEVEADNLSGDDGATTADYTSFDVAQTPLSQEPSATAELESGVAPFDPLMISDEQESAPYSAGGVSPSTAELHPGQEQVPAQGMHGFGGDDIEFENFMFDRGTSLEMTPLPDAQVEAFMPVVTEMESAFAPGTHNSAGTAPEAASPATPGIPPVRLTPAVESDGGDLPFWLRDAAEVEVTPGAGYVQTSPEATTAAGVPVVVMESAPAFQQPAEQNFADLPPIEPFDFSLLGLEEIDDGLGFNTEELTGGLPVFHERMAVTANLSALEEVISSGASRSLLSGVLNPKAGVQTETAALADQATSAQPIAPMVEESPADDSYDRAKHKTGKMPPSLVEDKARKPGWTATVTSSLALDALDNRTGSLPPAVGATGSLTGTDNLTMSDLGVAPFDFTDISSPEQETSTRLPTPTTNIADTPVEEKPKARKNWGTKKLQDPSEPEASHATQAPDAKQSAQQAQVDADTWLEDGGNTSIFNMRTPDAESAEDDELPTGRLSAEELQAIRRRNEATGPAAPSPSGGESGTNSGDQVVGVYKARVMSSGYSGRSAFAGQHSDDYQQLDYKEPDKESASMKNKTVDDIDYETSMQSQQGNQHVTPTSKLLNSGPLPELDSFVELQEIIEQNPEDISAHMALAAAYTQAGDFDPALRVYRRILKQRKVSPTILQMIGDELAEFDPTLHGQSRFHQVLGDLYMKQGLYQEAIAEYNKIK